MARTDRFVTLSSLRAKANASSTKYVILPFETQVRPGDMVILKLRVHNAGTWYSISGRAQRCGKASVCIGIPKAVYEALDAPVGSLLDLDMEVIYAEDP